MSVKMCKNTYFYIRDYLGSASMVLDVDGNISQSVSYIPYGEIFVEERNGAWNTARSAPQSHLPSIIIYNGNAPSFPLHVTIT